MGGHGGLNILPQKKWNVYNFDNREKVRKDEEAAAKEEHLKREQSRKRDTEFRLEQLRAARGLAPVIKPAEKEAEKEVEKDVPEEPKSNHINLFEGIKIFDPIKEDGASGEKEENNRKNKKVKREEVRVVTAEDEKYRLGYGLAGKGVKLPWYLEKRGDEVNGERDGDEDGSSSRGRKEEGKKSGKKTLEELREERLQREKREKCRERQLLLERRQREKADLKDRRFSRR